MPYLMEIAFDNDHRLCRKHYLFEYKGVRFKLIQNSPRKWADHLLTILPSGNDIEQQSAFSVASEFLSALCWANRARVCVCECAGGGWRSSLPITRARARVYTFPRIPFGGLTVGYSIDIIPKIETEEQRIALTLYREAGASNNDYLSFLFYWQILETGGTIAEGFVNKVQVRRPRDIQFVAKDIASLPLNGRRLGDYLRDEGRDAIAHIRRKPGKKKLQLDKITERNRVAVGTRVVKNLAEYYIRNELRLENQLYLKRKGKRAFPTYIGDDEYSLGGWMPAYQ